MSEGNLKCPYGLTTQKDQTQNLSSSTSYRFSSTSQLLQIAFKLYFGFMNCMKNFKGEFKIKIFKGFYPLDNFNMFLTCSNWFYSRARYVHKGPKSRQHAIRNKSLFYDFGKSRKSCFLGIEATHVADGLHPQDRDFKGKKPISGNEGPSLLELSGYNPKRQEFDIEYDNDAEQLLADMEFKDTDTEDEHELKLRVLQIYSKKLDERQRRKDFILERNLLYPSAFEKSLSKEHEELLKSIVEEHRNLKRLEALKEARDAGCLTSTEAEIYIEQKRKREADANACRENQSGHVPPSSQRGSNVFMASNSIGKDSNSRSSAGDMVNSGAELLSEALCNEIRVAPRCYLKMQEILSLQIFIGNITKKSDAYRIFKLEPAQIDRVYDMLVKKGIARP
ncbi:hypothetical protein UlMin_017543 [Ulmus minor]